MNETHEDILCSLVKDYHNQKQEMKDWLNIVGQRLTWNKEDMHTFLRLTKKDKAYLKSLDLVPNMSYYVVAPKREYLEKFRVYYTVRGPKTWNDYIAFTQKVFLSSYEKQIDNFDFKIDSLVVAQQRLLVYCHKNNNYVSDKQAAWIQGNLFSSDICDRLIQGNRVLILSEYDVKELDNLVGTLRLTKIAININKMDYQGIYDNTAAKKKPTTNSNDSGMYD